MHTSEVASHRLNALQLLFAFVINGLAEVIQVKRVDAGLPESEPAPATSDQRRSGGDGRMTMGRKWGTNLIIWHRNFEEKDVLIDICNICGTTTIVSQFRKDIVAITSGVSSQLCYRLQYIHQLFFFLIQFIGPPMDVKWAAARPALPATVSTSSTSIAL